MPFTRFSLQFRNHLSPISAFIYFILAIYVGDNGFTTGGFASLPLLHADIHLTAVKPGTVKLLQYRDGHCSGTTVEIPAGYVFHQPFNMMSSLFIFYTRQ